VYHCTPRQLEQEDLDTILDHLTCLLVEAVVRTLRRQTTRRATPTFRRRR
jgi:hypothetical protein